MLVNKNNLTRIEDGGFELRMGNHISKTSTYRYLGLLVDEQFSWANHINEIFWKLSQVAGIIYKVRTLLTKEAMMLVYHSLVSRKLRYGLVCWASASQFLLDKVNVVHNKIIIRHSWLGGRFQNVPKQSLGCKSTKYNVKDKKSEDFFVTWLF